MHTGCQIRAQNNYHTLKKEQQQEKKYSDWEKGLVEEYFNSCLTYKSQKRKPWVDLKYTYFEKLKLKYVYILNQYIKLKYYMPYTYYTLTYTT